jgi:hypothetical protein
VDQNDLAVAKSIGALETDVRTLKHDVGNVSTKIDGLSNQITQITNQQSKGLGFFAGAASIITLFGGAMLFLAKALFGGVIASGRVHP